MIIPIDEFTVDNGCTQIGSNWKEFTKLENGRFILPQVQSGPAKGTVPKDISQSYSNNNESFSIFHRRTFHRRIVASNKTKLALIFW